MFTRDRGDRQLGFADISLAAGSVPEEHRLLQMRRAVNWEGIEKSLARYYDAWTGRPFQASGFRVQISESAVLKSEA